MKRRRAKHKGIHTNKKSYVEILKEVIDEQMVVFNEYIEQTCARESSSKMREHSFPNGVSMENSSKNLTEDKDRHKSRKHFEESRSHRSKEYKHKNKQKKRSRSKSRDKKSHKQNKHHKKHKSRDRYHSIASSN